MLNKYFPLWVHFILICVVIGLAAGLEVEPNIRPLVLFGVRGLAVGLGLSWVGRLFVS